MAAAGIVATVGVVAAFYVPTRGPAWFLTYEYGVVALFATLVWGAPCLLAAHPGDTVRDAAATVLLFVALAAITAPPRFWAVRLGQAELAQAVSGTAMFAGVTVLCGTTMIHGVPGRYRRTFDAAVMWVIVQVGAYWAILSA